MKTTILTEPKIALDTCKVLVRQGKTFRCERVTDPEPGWRFDVEEDSASPAVYELFIVTAGGIYGVYGKGKTLTEAHAAFREAGGKKKDGNYRIQRFASHLPFAPFGCDATEDEADAWIGQDGSVNWIRCEREVLKLDDPRYARIK